MRMRLKRYIRLGRASGMTADGLHATKCALRALRDHWQAVASDARCNAAPMMRRRASDRVTAYEQALAILESNARR